MLHYSEDINLREICFSHFSRPLKCGSCLSGKFQLSAKFKYFMAIFIKSKLYIVHVVMVNYPFMILVTNYNYKEST